MVMYSTVGINTIVNSTFIWNRPLMMNNSDTYSGGGGVYVEFAYCYPGNISCFNGPSNTPDYFTKDSTYIISDCVFSNNLASVTAKSQLILVLPQKSNHMALGRGGGISLFFKGCATNNTIIIEKSEFTNNTAVWGGGLFVEMQDFSSSNSVTISNSTISGNKCLFKESSTHGTGGGGARVGYIFFKDTHARLNSISFQNCKFHGNAAYFGGGVSFCAAREPNETSPTNSLTFQNTTWLENVARAGSAADLSVWRSQRYGATTRVHFISCSFEANEGSCISEQNMVVGVGALYLDSIPVTFVGDNLFLGNTHSALSAITTGIHVLPNSSITFTNNSGRHGAAIALGSAFIETHPFSSLVFVNNSAEISGGAIYEISTGEHDLNFARNCFIRYNDITVPPNKWNTNFSFSGNTANGKNESVFTSSLLNCEWGEISENSSQELSKVFCSPNIWTYNGNNCTSEIRTLPVSFASNSNFMIKTFPGQRHRLNLILWDDRGRDVTSSSVLLAKSLSGGLEVATSSKYISDNHIQVHTEENKEINGVVLLETVDPRVVQVMLNVTVFPCPLGMVLVTAGDSGSCQCGGSFNGFVECNETGFYTKIQRGSWLGLHTHNDEQRVVAGSTSYFISSSNDSYITLPRRAKEIDSTICGSVKRKGVLCGECVDGYGPSIHTLECIRCDANYMWTLYLLSQYLPVTLLFIVVVVLDIRVTSAQANAFIFFAQVFPNVFTLNGGGAIPMPQAGTYLVRVCVFLYNMWNLQFFKLDICLSPTLSSLQAISLTYLEAAYPLLMILIVSLFVWLYEGGVRFVICIFRPLHILLARFQRHWNIRRSLVHTFASFILLSYSRFIFVSFLLLTTQPLFTDSGKVFDWVMFFDGSIRFLSSTHIPFALLSLLVLLTFGLVTPLLLIVPSVSRNLSIICRRWPKLCPPLLSLNQSTIHRWPKFVAFLEVFHGCYRDGTKSSQEFDYRWCAGFYLVLRAALYAVYAFNPDWSLQYSFLQLLFTLGILVFAILRPYKDDFYNNLDTAMFAVLLAVNILTTYNYTKTVLGTQPSLATFIVQYFLVLLPLIYIPVVLLKHLCRYCPRKQCCCSFLVKDTQKEILVGNNNEESTVQSELDDYLSFMGETGRLNDVNVYRPLCVAIDTSNEQFECTSSECESRDFGTQQSSSTTCATDYHKIEELPLDKQSQQRKRYAKCFGRGLENKS